MKEFIKSTIRIILSVLQVGILGFFAIFMMVAFVVFLIKGGNANEIFWSRNGMISLLIFNAISFIKLIFTDKIERKKELKNANKALIGTAMYAVLLFCRYFI